MFPTFRTAISRSNVQRDKISDFSPARERTKKTKRRSHHTNAQV